MRGKLCETGFRPSLKPRKFFTTGAVSIDGVACIACGHLELQISPEELIELLVSLHRTWVPEYRIKSIALEQRIETPVEGLLRTPAPTVIVRRFNLRVTAVWDLQVSQGIRRRFEMLVVV